LKFRKSFLFSIVVLFICSIVLPTINVNAATESTSTAIKSMAVNTKKISGEGKLEITAELSPNIFPQDMIIAVNYDKPIENKYAYVELKPTENKNIYKGELNLSQGDAQGVWQATWITIRDKNRIYFSISDEALLNNASFELTGGKSDITAPELKSISVDKNIVASGEELKVTAEIVDDSGNNEIYARVSAEPENTYNKGRGIELTYTGQGNIYEGKLNITDYFNPGLWLVDGVTLEDSAGNHAFVPVQPQGSCKFNVTGTNGDELPPEVKSLTIDKKFALPGDVVKVTSEVTDDFSGVSKVSLYYTIEGRDDGPMLKLYPTSNKNIFEGYVHITKYDKVGTWEFTGALVEDNNGSYQNVRFSSNPTKYPLDSRKFSVGTSTSYKGWKNISGKWYYFNPTTGVMQTGWLSYNGKWYYLNRDGVMATGWANDGQKWYYLNDNGEMQTGWILSGGKWYYLSKSGAMDTGWISYNNKWYYLNNKGAMETGWVLYNNQWYYLEGSGVMKTGWISYGGSWYFLKSSGAMQTGWLSNSGKWYYLYNDGRMAASTVIEGFKIGSNGAWIR